MLATDHLTDTAQQELAALRGSLVNKLTVLEAVLADPSRGESLAGLILDLSRVATEEAQAAAAVACLAATTEADRQMAELRASAKTALDAAQSALRAANESLEQERAASADLRRELERAQLELVTQNELLKAREEYEKELKAARETLAEELGRAREQMGYEVDRQQAIATELARERDAALADVRARLDAEQTANAELRWSLERTENRLAALEREHADARASSDADREKLEAGGAALHQTKAELEAERAALAGVRVDLEQARAGLETERAALDRTRAELEAERAANEALRSQLGDVDAQQSDLDAASQRVGALTAERDALAVELLGVRNELAAAQRWIQELREAEAEFAAAAAAGAAGAGGAGAATAAAARTDSDKPSIRPATATVEGPDGGWQAIRLASRFVFSKAVAIEINSAPATLLDVSVSGCQLVSESPLKPHQTVKVQLASAPLLVCSGKIVWTRLELAGAGRPPAYRAGVRFIAPDEAAIEAFAARVGNA
jgi:hypothetical protein